MLRLTRLAFLARLAFPILGMGLALSACSPGEKTAGVDPACFNRTSDKIGGPISLIAEDGSRVTEGNFKGRKTLVFFGFTYCPDFCPRTLMAIGTAVTMLPKGVDAPKTAFISVDPARDTPEQLKAYIHSTGFPGDIVGLTGNDDELDAATKAFVAPYERVDDPQSAAGYTVNHSTILYLMDENWKLETFFQPDARPQEIAACIAALSK